MSRKKAGPKSETKAAMQRGLKRGLIISLGALAVVTALIMVDVLAPPNAQREMLFEPVKIGGPFSLVDQNNRPVTDESFRGKLMLVYFGYTYCPDVCPTELQVMGLALDELGPLAEKVQPIFITIDPDRDTADMLKEYVASFHERFVGLTGTADQIKAAAAAYKVYYGRAADKKTGEKPGEQGSTASIDYLMDHSGFVYLMDEQGRYAAHFRAGTAPADIAKRIRTLLGK